jgi:hypothetical protein
MRVLVACEFSGRVRDAFARRGHDAWSCDILPSETPGNHILGDALQVLGDGWDLLIAHPPCTYLSNAGIGFFNVEKYGAKAVERMAKRQDAMDFFMKLYNAPIDRVCVENPVGYPNSFFRKPDQVIHPYFFGERHLKRTCLWLRNLPPLWFWMEDDLFGTRTATEYPEPLHVHERKPGRHYKGGEVKKRYFTDAKAIVNGTKINASHERSRTFPAIAEAMAAQWGQP